MPKLTLEELRAELKKGQDQLDAGLGLTEDEVFAAVEEAIRKVEERRPENESGKDSHL